MKKKIKVLIADDHYLFRAGVISILNNNDDFEVIADCENGKEAIKYIRDKNPDIALLDIDMPEMNGLEVAKEVYRNKLPTTMAIITIHKEKGYFEEALDYGVMAYLLKDSIANDLPDCLRTISKNEYYISPLLSGYLLDKKKDKDSPLLSLTPSEKKIIKLIAQNKSNKQIADELFISERTVENHRANVTHKLGLKGRNSLLLFAIENKDNI